MNNRALRSNTKTSLSVSKHFHHNSYRTKIYLCVGCNKSFSQFKSPSQYINSFSKSSFALSINCEYKPLFLNTVLSCDDPFSPI